MFVKPERYQQELVVIRVIDIQTVRLAYRPQPVDNLLGVSIEEATTRLDEPWCVFRIVRLLTMIFLKIVQQIYHRYC